MSLRRLATALAGLGLLWACAATVYLLTATGYEGVATASVTSASGIDAHRVSASLVSANGLWVVSVLTCVTFLAGLPLGVALAHPRGHRATTWVAGLLLLGFSIVSGFSVGLFYVPSALLLMLSAAVASPGRASLVPGP